MIRLIGAALAVSAALVVPAAGPAAPESAEAVVLPDGYDWNADASSFRGQDGKRFTFLCPADGAVDRAWGTTVYTDDSSVCTAALQMGAIKLADGGTVTVEIRPGQASYTGSTKNGVTTESYAQWSGSFVVIGGKPGSDVAGISLGGVGWNSDVQSHRGKDGTKYRYLCPPGGSFSTVWGTNVYTDDSSVCTAAVQTGELTAAGGGYVTVEVRPGQTAYYAFTYNGVTSKAYHQWSGSFIVSGAPRIPGSPSGAPPGGGGGGGSTTTTSGGGAGAPPTATPTGTVLVNGRPFTSGTIPYNAVVDVTQGTVLLKADVGTLKVSGADGISAVFVLVRGREGKKPVVELRLTKGDFGVCPKRKTSSARAAGTTVRQLWADGKGSFRTSGRYASATVRGTNWLTSDRCDGTNIKVRRGVIQVVDRPQQRQVTVRAPRSYLARP